MRELLEFIEDQDTSGFASATKQRLSSILGSRFSDKAKEIMMNEEGADVPDPSQVSGTLEDPIIDPTMDKEVFFKRYNVGKREVVIKRVGFGPNAPSITYIDGIRYEVFTTPQQAEKETLRAIKDGSFDKIQSEREKKKQQAMAAEQPPSPEKTEESFEFLASIIKDRQDKLFTFENGESTTITLDEAADTLESIKMLNNENRLLFAKNMRAGLSQYKEMLDFLLDRVRKGVI